MGQVFRCDACGEIIEGEARGSFREGVDIEGKRFHLRISVLNVEDIPASEPSFPLVKVLLEPPFFVDKETDLCEKCFQKVRGAVEQKLAVEEVK